MNDLADFIINLRKDSQIKTYDEAATKQTLILPILNFLGWKIFDRNIVYPEYGVSTRNVDYSLRIGSRNEVFIEAKRVGTDLKGQAEDQLLDYAFKEGIKLAILCDGINWSFYLPLQAKTWKERRFYSINIVEQDESQVAEKLVSFLSYENVKSGNAIKAAEATLDEKARHDTIIKTIPEVLENIFSEKNEFLVELIAEETEKFCGFRPEEDLIINFLEKVTIIQNGLIVQPSKPLKIKKQEVLPKIERSRSKLSWSDYCFQALQNLGGEARLKDIYEEVAKLKKNNNEPLTKTYDASIRGCLEMHSRGGGKDLFEPISIGSGRWKIK